jgi:hypothetical protein
VRRAVLLLALLTLSACSKPAEKEYQSYSEDVTDVAIIKPAAPAAAKTASAKAGEAQSAPTGPPKIQVSIPRLAYSYDYAISASPKGVRGLMAKHQAACAAAGPAVCQMTGALVSEGGKDQVSGTLSLTATPAWLTTFRAGLEGDAKAAGGRVTRANTQSEDLSLQISDTEAALRARTTLRDRLQGLLESRPGKLSDLLEVERSLAEVQGEIDAAQSALAVLRSRVETSRLEITYSSGGVLAPQGVFAPLARAFEDVLGILASTLAGMIRLVAWTAPWVLVIGLFAWVFRRRLPKWTRRSKKAAPSDPPTG